MAKWTLPEGKIYTQADLDAAVTAALDRALAAEREQCAKIAFTMVCEFGEPAFAGIVGDAIRAQGDKP